MFMTYPLFSLIGSHRDKYRVPDTRWQALALASLIMAGALGIVSGMSTARGTDSKTSAGTPTPRVWRVMPLGDSITNDYVSGNYRYPLGQKLVTDGQLPVDFVGSQNSGPEDMGDKDNEGHSGWSIKGHADGELTAHVSAWLEDAQPDVVLLHAGTNDLLNQASGATALNRLDELLEEIFVSRPGIKVLVASLIDIQVEGVDQQMLADFNSAIPGLVAKHFANGREAYFADMARAHLTTGTGSDIPDGIHPDSNGYAKMADVWYTALRAIID